jgi:hypothetical protein
MTPPAIPHTRPPHPAILRSGLDGSSPAILRRQHCLDFLFHDSARTFRARPSAALVGLQVVRLSRRTDKNPISTAAKQIVLSGVTLRSDAASGCRSESAIGGRHPCGMDNVLAIPSYDPSRGAVAPVEGGHLTVELSDNGITITGDRAGLLDLARWCGPRRSGRAGWSARPPGTTHRPPDQSIATSPDRSPRC